MLNEYTETVYMKSRHSFTLYLHKCIMPHCYFYFPCISGSKTRRDLILVSIPMLSGSRNTNIIILISLGQLFTPYLQKFIFTVILNELKFAYMLSSKTRRHFIFVFLMRIINEWMPKYYLSIIQHRKHWNIPRCNVLKYPRTNDSFEYHGKNGGHFEFY